MTQTFIACTDGSSDLMQILFDKPFKKNDKIGNSPILDDSASSQVHNQEQKKAALIKDLIGRQRPGNQGSLRRSSLAQATVATEVPARPSRPTRATVSNYNQHASQDDEQIEKYSITVGLGPRWDK